jgi:hypothetical protein
MTSGPLRNPHSSAERRDIGKHVTFHDKWRAIFHEICRDRFMPTRFWLRMIGAAPPPMRQISLEKTTPNNLETDTNHRS